jgi:hypothetical protein
MATPVRTQQNARSSFQARQSQRERELREARQREAQEAQVRREQEESEKRREAQANQRYGGLTVAEYNELISTYGEGGRRKPVSKASDRRRREIQSQLNAFRQEYGLKGSVVVTARGISGGGTTYLKTSQGMAQFKPGETYGTIIQPSVQVREFTVSEPSIIGAIREDTAPVVRATTRPVGSKIDITATRGGVINNDLQKELRASLRAPIRIDASIPVGLTDIRQETRRETPLLLSETILTRDGPARRAQIPNSLERSSQDFSNVPVSALRQRLLAESENPNLSFGDQFTRRAGGILLTPVAFGSEIAAETQRGGIGAGVARATRPVTQTVEGVVGLIPATTQSFIERGPQQTLVGGTRSVVGGLQTQLSTSPGAFAAETTSFIGESLFLGSTTTRGLQLFRDVRVRAGATAVPAEDIFAIEVLQGRTRFPLSRSTGDALSQFRSGRTPDGFLVTTASPRPISGNVVIQNPKGAAGLEDAGLFTTPVGRGSPAFTGVMGTTSTEYSFSLNPFSGIRRPTVTEVEVRNIGLVPQNILRQPGFRATQQFQQDVFAPRGIASITKRSQLGQRDIPRQRFTADVDFQEGNFNIRRGDIRREAGTSEIEAIVPTGTILEDVTGNRRFTRLNGNIVEIRRKRAVPTQDVSISTGLNLKSGASRSVPKAFVPSSQPVSRRVVTVSVPLPVSRPRSAVSSSKVVSSFFAGSTASALSSSSVSQGSSAISIISSSRTRTGKSSIVSRPRNTVSSFFSGSSRASSISQIGSSSSTSITSSLTSFTQSSRPRPPQRKKGSRKRRKEEDIFKVDSRGYTQSLITAGLNLRGGLSKRERRFNALTGLGLRL